MWVDKPKCFKLRNNFSAILVYGPSYRHNQKNFIVVHVYLRSVAMFRFPDDERNISRNVAKR